MGEWLRTLPGTGKQNNSETILCRPAGLSDDESDCYSDDDYYYDDHNYTAQEPTTIVQQPQKPQKLLQPLRLSVVQGSPKEFQDCLERVEDFDLNETLDGQWTALMYACNSARPEMISFLLEKGVGVHKDRPLIALACSSNTNSVIDCAKLLLDHGVDVNATDSELRATTLHFAVKGNNIELVKFLLENGAQIDAVDTDRQSPLHWATSRGFGPVIKILLKFHPNLDIVNRSGLTPYESAAFNGFSKTAKTLYLYQKSENPSEVDLSALNKNEQKDEGNDWAPRDRNYVETILSNLKLTKHLESFNKHEIDIAKFMLLTDEEMSKVGVSKLGDRINLRDKIRMIHNLDWKPNSLFDFSVNGTITLPESTNLFKNIELHLELMDTTVKYLTQRSQVSKEQSKVLNPGLDKKEVVRMLEYCKKLVTALETLKQSQSSFLEYIEKIQENEEYRLGDLISSVD